jgi:hypothetical protein
MAPVITLLVSMIALLGVLHASPAVPLSDTDVANLATGEDRSLDGLYVVDEDPVTKKQSHFKVRDLSDDEALASRPRALESLESRGYDGFPSDAYITCPESWTWSEDFYKHAYDGLWKICWCYGEGSQHIKSIARGTYNYIYVRYGQAVAYFCNFGVGGNSAPNRCTNSEWGVAVGVMNQQCTNSDGNWARAGKSQQLR